MNTVSAAVSQEHPALGIQEQHYAITLVTATASSKYLNLTTSTFLEQLGYLYYVTT